jgi:hypothetical protein
MVSLSRPYKLSGMVPTDDSLHLEVDLDSEEIAPAYVRVGEKKVAQYAPTVVGSSLGYNPSGDCDGHFTSSRFQPNNNCYNYACDIATNSYAQPGRMQGFFLQSQGGPTGPVIRRGAELDGLRWIAGGNVSVADLVQSVSEHKPGHLVALLISPADSLVDWNGDYHWVRCDTANCASWSQKDGTDQVTDFDFAGNKIRDPRNAIWKVNQGPRSKTNPKDFLVNYDFFGFMFVPAGGVKII